jgi:N-acyl-D-aspartate/D-glutamate deacylase
VFDDSVLTLPQAVQRSSALAAQTFGLTDRGVVREGAFADVIAFDPRTIADRATFENPRLMSTGVQWVLVNGAISVENGRYSGALGGRALRRGGMRPAPVR